jgi:hypothetical protein
MSLSATLKDLLAKAAEPALPWYPNPDIELRKFTNGTCFCLKSPTGKLQICRLAGNRRGGQPLQVKRFPQLQVVPLARYRDCQFAIIFDAPGLPR